MKPRKELNELGTYNPYTREYEAVLTNEERAEEFNREHEHDEGSGVAGGTEPGTGELVDRESQPDEWDPYSMSWKKAGDK